MQNQKEFKYGLQMFLVTGISFLCLFILTTGCGSSDESSSNNTAFADGVDSLPFKHEFDPSDERLYAVVNEQKFVAEFSGWGSHANGHTGHGEGDAKSNYSIYLTPENEQIEFSNHANNPNGNNDDFCDPGESCGITANVALKHAVWYYAPHDMKLVRVNPSEGIDTSGSYIEGEASQWVIDFTVGDTNFKLDHVGELSQEIEDLLVSRFGEGVKTNPSSIDFNSLLNDHIDIAKGTKLARPQITYSFQSTVNGQVIYYAHSQVEWFVDSSSNPDGTCFYKNYSVEDQAKLQSAMDANFSTPHPYGRFVGYGSATSVDIYVAAQGKICNRDRFDLSDYSRLSNEVSRTWVEKAARHEALSIYPINKDAKTYQTHAAEYDSTSVNYMFRWLIPNNSTDVITATDGVQTYRFFDASGEILNLADETATSGSFVMKFGDVGTILVEMENGSPDPAGMYLGFRYRLAGDKLILTHGELETTLSSVQLPAEIPVNASCSGSYQCYDHSYTELF